MATGSFPGPFGDLNKSASVLLFAYEKDPTFNNKDQITWNTTSSDGVKTLSKFTKDCDKYVGTLEFKLPKHVPHGLESSFTFETKGVLKGQVTTDKLVPGLKTGLGSEIKVFEGKQDLHWIVEYKYSGFPQFSLANKLAVPFAAGGFQTEKATANTSVVLGTQQNKFALVGGVESKFNLTSRDVQTLNVFGEYRGLGFVAAAYYKHAAKSPKSDETKFCGLTGYWKPMWGKNLELATDLEFNTLVLGNSASASPVPVPVPAPAPGQENAKAVVRGPITLTGAAGWDLGVGTRVNTRLDTNSSARVVFTHKLNDNVKVRLGSDLNILSGLTSAGFVELNVTD